MRESLTYGSVRGIEIYVYSTANKLSHRRPGIIFGYGLKGALEAFLSNRIKTAIMIEG